MSAILLMTYCLVGQPCEKETVAIFPQWDVGMRICELAKPGVERGVRSKLGKDVKMNMRCEEVDDDSEPEIPRATLETPQNTTMYSDSDDMMRQAVELMEMFKK